MLGIEQKIEKVAKKTAAFSVGGMLALVGIAFLTSAAWIFLSELKSSLFAATTIGLVYFGCALIVMAIGASSGRDKKPAVKVPEPEELSPMQMVAVSFIQGFENGRKSKR